MSGTAPNEGDRESAFDVDVGDDTDDAEFRFAKKINDPKKRVLTMISRAKAAEARASAAEERASELERQLVASNASSAASTASTELASAQAALKAARFDGDAEAEAAALTRMTAAQINAHDAERTRAMVEARSKQAREAPAAPQVSSAVQDWLDENPWFHADPAMNTSAMGFHADAVRRGIKAESPEYFAHIDRKMRAAYPEEFEDADTGDEGVTPATRPASRPSAPAAPRRNAATTQTPRTVRLSPEQREAARIAGVSDQQYAAALVARSQRT
jgi:hypothetical protein